MSAPLSQAEARTKQLERILQEIVAELAGAAAADNSISLWARICRAKVILRGLKP